MNRLHPLTVPLRAVNAAGTVVIALVFTVVLGSAEPGLSPLFIGIGLLAVIALLGYQYAYYRRFTYAVTADTIDIASGVISRQRREIPLDRIQNVDISEGVLQRALGIAAVDFETAGGGSTEARLRYVSVEEARRLQNVVRGHEPETEAEGESAPSQETGEVLFELNRESLLVLSLVSFDLRVFSLFQTAIAFASPAVLASVFDLPLLLVVPAIAGGILIAVIGGWLLGAIVTFVRYYGFRLTRVADELRYERGLLQRYSGTIPLEKVQTLSVTENVLMRRLGFAGLAIETAGYGSGEEPSGGSEAAVPLDDREAVLALARELEPFGDPSLKTPPQRTHDRYTRRYRLLAGAMAFLGIAAAWWFELGVPGYGTAILVGAVGVVLAGPAATRGYHSRGYVLNDDYAITRNGWWRRQTTVVPAYRLQTVIDRRSVFQRRWDLASLEFDTAGSLSLTGPSGRAVDIDAAQSTTLQTEAADALQRTLTQRRHHRSRDKET